MDISYHVWSLLLLRPVSRSFLKQKLHFYSSGCDPSQHILDTLEQCISVIIEKIQRLDQDQRNGSRMSSIDYNKANEGEMIYINIFYNIHDASVIRNDMYST